MRRLLGVVFGLALTGAPVEAKPLGGIVQLAAGTDHACAVLSSGQVACWGDHQPKPATGDPRAPAIVPGVSGAIAIGAAQSGTCALLKSGEVWCWGIDWYIGRNHTTVGHGNQPPGPVAGITDATQIAMGVGFGGACALHKGGTVSCWGDNRYGHFGTPTKLEHNPAPVRVPGISNAVELAVGITGTCARLATGEVSCWGDGSYATATPPKLVPQLTGAIAISVGQRACALRANGTVTCWKIETPDSLDDLGIKGATALRDNGVSINCVVLRDRKVQCWGSGLPFPGGVTPKTPTPVAGLTDVRQLALGGQFACALRGDATATCWGINYARQLGRATPSIVAAPATVRGVSSARAVAVGHTSACALIAKGVTCWGDGKPAALIGNTGDAVQLAMGEHRACVRTRTSRIACWEFPGTGPAVEVPNVTDVAHVAVDGAFCVVHASGKLTCERRDDGWKEIDNATHVAISGDGGCARLADEQVRCWGIDRMPRRDPDRYSRKNPAPRTQVMARDAKQIAANDPLICVLHPNEVRCLSGGVTRVQVDNGVRSGSNLATVKDPSLAQLAVGWAHACVRRQNGTVGCWGYNHAGQLGGGPVEETPRDTPVEVKLTGVVDVAAGENTTCAAMRSGAVACWGNNSDGQVGNGTSGTVYTVGAPVEAPR